jgi:sialic acid synthase SpsE
MEKKTKEKGIQILESIYSNIYKFPNFTTKEYLHTKVHQMQTNIHKEKGMQNLLSIYENLQFPKFTTRTCMHHKSIKVEG